MAAKDATCERDPLIGSSSADFGVFQAPLTFRIGRYKVRIERSVVCC